jgi:hypothetical protein
VFVGALRGESEGSVVILNTNGKVIGRISNLPGRPTRSALSPDGKFLAVPIGMTGSGGSYEGRVALYDLTRMKRVWLSPNLGDYPWETAFLLPQHAVVTIVDNGNLCFLSMSDGSVIRCVTHKGWAGDSIALIPSRGLLIVTMDKKAPSGEYSGKVIAYRIGLTGGGQPSTTAPQTTAMPTTPATTHATTSEVTGDVTTPAATTKPGGGMPWHLIAGGAIGAAVVVALALVVLKRRSRASPYPPIPPPPPA